MSESHGLKGCGNHGCLVQPIRKGDMGTNAICQCVRRDGILAERMVQWLRSQLVGKDAEVDETKEFLEVQTRNAARYCVQLFETKEQIVALTDKAIRFDLDQAGIERREAEATELVDLRAEVSALKARLEALGMHADELAAELKEAQV